MYSYEAEPKSACVYVCACACACVYMCACMRMRSCDPRTYVSCFAGSIGHGLRLIRAWQVREGPGVRTVASHSLHFIQRQRQEKRTEVKKTKCVSHETVLIVHTHARLTHTHTIKKCMIAPPQCLANLISSVPRRQSRGHPSDQSPGVEWRSALSDLTPISTFLCRGLVRECICLH